jgi:hypothetical protein
LKKEFVKILDKIGNDRLRVKLDIDKGIIKNVVFQYECYINAKWTEIVRYDCAHGFFHKDVMYPNGDKEKTEIIIPTLKDSASYAEQDIKDRWEWYKERNIKKLKNDK